MTRSDGRICKTFARVCPPRHVDSIVSPLTWIHLIPRQNGEERSKEDDEVAHKLQPDGQPPARDEGGVVADLVDVDLLLVDRDEALGRPVGTDGGRPAYRLAKVAVDGGAGHGFETLHLPVWSLEST